MSNEQKSQDQQNGQPAQGQQEQQQPGSQQGTDSQSQQQEQQQDQQHAPPDFDGLKNKKPEELTPEELRWMADTMPGEGPGD